MHYNRNNFIIIAFKKEEKNKARNKEKKQNRQIMNENQKKAISCNYFKFSESKGKSE